MLVLICVLAGLLLPTPRVTQVVIAKENNFKQAGERFRSFDKARQERFVGRVLGMLLDARWVGTVQERFGSVFRMGLLPGYGVRYCAF